MVSGSIDGVVSRDLCEKRLRLHNRDTFHSKASKVARDLQGPKLAANDETRPFKCNLPTSYKTVHEPICSRHVSF